MNKNSTNIDHLPKLTQLNIDHLPKLPKLISSTKVSILLKLAMVCTYCIYAIHVVLLYYCR